MPDIKIEVTAPRGDGECYVSISAHLPEQQAKLLQQMVSLYFMTGESAPLTDAEKLARRIAVGGYEIEPEDDK